VQGEKSQHCKRFFYYPSMCYVSYLTRLPADTLKFWTSLSACISRSLWVPPRASSCLGSLCSRTNIKPTKLETHNVVRAHILWQCLWWLLTCSTQGANCRWSSDLENHWTPSELPALLIAGRLVWQTQASPWVPMRQYMGKVAYCSSWKLSCIINL